MPETVDTSSEAVERLATRHEAMDLVGDNGDLTSRVLRALLAERDAMHVDINRLHAERQALEDRCVALQRERDEAITALGVASRAQGLAEGKLEASETAGVVDGWKRRAEAAEAQRDALLKVVTAAKRYVETGKQFEERDLERALDALPPELREMVDQS